MLLKIRSVRWRKGPANASMNLNFCVKWLRQTASGGKTLPISDCRFQIGGGKSTAPRCRLKNLKSEIAKADYIGAHGFEVARPIRARERFAAGGKSRTESDQQGFA